jgi:hypothetical protein
MPLDLADAPDRSPNGLTWQRNEPGLLFNGLGTQALAEVGHFSIPARGERRCHGRDAIRRIRFIRYIRTPLVCRGRPSRAGIYREGVFGCFG